MQIQSLCFASNSLVMNYFVGKDRSSTGSRRHNKGCNCKRSGCLKNYCECYEVSRPVFEQFALQSKFMVFMPAFFCFPLTYGIRCMLNTLSTLESKLNTLLLYSAAHVKKTSKKKKIVLVECRGPINVKEALK